MVQVVSLRCKECGAKFKGVDTRFKYCAAHAPRQREGVPPQPRTDVGGRSWVPEAKIKLADRVEQWLFAHDDANECAHGALPHDRKIPKGCGCWGERLEFEKPEPEVKPKKQRKVA